MGQIDDLIQQGRALGCSDIHLTFGLPPMARKNGKLIKMQGHEVLDAQQLQVSADDMLIKCQIQRPQDPLEEIDFCYEAADGSRNRVNIYYQQKKNGNRHTIAKRIYSYHGRTEIT